MRPPFPGTPLVPHMSVVSGRAREEGRGPRRGPMGVYGRSRRGPTGAYGYMSVYGRAREESRGRGAEERRRGPVSGAAYIIKLCIYIYIYIYIYMYIYIYVIHIYIYIHTYIYIYIYTHIHIYIYIYREREIERERYVCRCLIIMIIIMIMIIIIIIIIYLYIYAHIHIYIYIYIHTSEGTSRQAKRNSDMEMNWVANRYLEKHVFNMASKHDRTRRGARCASLSQSFRELPRGPGNSTP